MRIAAALIAGLLVVGSARAQQPEHAPASHAQPSADERPDRPDRAGAPREINLDRLKRRVHEARARADRLEAALARLEAGDGLREVMRDLRPDERRYFMPWSGRNARGEGDQPYRRVGAMRPDAEQRAGGAGERPTRPGAPLNDRPSERPARSPEHTPVSPEQVRAFIATHLKEMDQHLSGIEAQHPGASARFIERLAPRIKDVINAKRRDATLGELKLQELKRSLETIKIAREAREAARGHEPTPELIANTRQRLTNLLTAQAEIRAKIQQREVELLEDRIESLRAELAERESERSQVVEEMVDQMMRRLLRGAPGRSAGGGATPKDAP